MNYTASYGHNLNETTKRKPELYVCVKLAKV